MPTKELEERSWLRLRIWYRLFVSCSDWRTRGTLVRRAWKQRNDGKH